MMVGEMESEMVGNGQCFLQRILLYLEQKRCLLIPCWMEERPKHLPPSQSSIHRCSSKRKFHPMNTLTIPDGTAIYYKEVRPCHPIP